MAMAWRRCGRARSVGTALGQGLALRNVRGWFTAAIVGMAALVLAPMLAVGGAPATLWQALLPAVLCGYWSLGERMAPAAFWFPAMTWMLTDRRSPRW